MPDSSTLPREDVPDTVPASPDARGAEAVEPAPPLPKPPLVLAKGTRLRLGYRKGKVDTVRGSWKKPYDVRVVWDGEKYPQWLIFTTLELDYESGNLEILG